MRRIPQSQSEWDLEMGERAMRKEQRPEKCLRSLRRLAHLIFIDRNLAGLDQPGSPKQDLATLKAEVRPFLREAIGWVRKSRDALLAGDIERHKLLRDRARMYYAFAALEVYQPYAKRYGNVLVAIARHAVKGGKGKAEHAKTEKFEDGIDLDELDGLIKAGIARKEKPPIADWCGVYQISRSALYRRIGAAKKKM